MCSLFIRMNQITKLDNLIVLSMIIASGIFVTSGRKEIMIEMYRSPGWRMGIVAITLFIMYYMFVDPRIRKRSRSEEMNIKRGIVAGLFSFLLALMAELHLTVPTFFIGFSAAYYYSA